MGSERTFGFRCTLVKICNISKHRLHKVKKVRPNKAPWGVRLLRKAKIDILLFSLQALQMGLDKCKIVWVFNAFSLFYTAGSDQVVPLQYSIYSRY
jgi:hypothetical protein